MTPESSREERRAGRTITVKCTEAIVGDETGKIVLFTRQQEKVEALVQGAHVALLNVYVFFGRIFERIQFCITGNCDGFKILFPSKLTAGAPLKSSRIAKISFLKISTQPSS